MKEYSCDECKNRMTGRCSRCIRTIDKKPSRFKLDKNAVPCPTYSNDNQECNLIASIREWKEELEKITLEINSQEHINIKPVIDFLYATSGVIPKSFHYGDRIDSEFAIHIISQAFRLVSCKQLVDTIRAIHQREEILIELRRKRNEYIRKIEDAKKKLGI